MHSHGKLIFNFDTNRYHPDKNANNPEASELFQEVAYAYSILSDPEKRRQYDAAGFEVGASQQLNSIQEKRMMFCYGALIKLRKENIRMLCYFFVESKWCNKIYL